MSINMSKYRALITEMVFTTVSQRNLFHFYGTALMIINLVLTASVAFSQQTITIGSETKLLKKYSAYAVTTDETAHCLGCHSTRMPKLVEAWEHSTHAKNGVGCYECHKAEKGDPTSKQGHFSYNVQLPVSAAHCGFCHQEEYEQFAVSRHATAIDLIKSMPMKESNPELFEISCASCHGSVVNMKKGKAVDATWPNQGIGRKNPDGSLGSCAACHGYHNDSLAHARDIQTCARCHDNDFSPAMRSWSRSAHAINSTKNVEDVDLTKKHINLTEDAVMKPNCQTCHVSAPTKNGKATHNISARISWNLKAIKAHHTDDWGTKRLEMQKSCRNCHASTQIEQYYRKFDAAVVATNHIVDKKIKPDAPIWEVMPLHHSLKAFRIGAAMLGIVDPLKIEELSH